MMHTPTPLEVLDNEVGGVPICYRNKAKMAVTLAHVRYLGTADHSIARNIAYEMVRAVNSHDALVKALQMCHKKLCALAERDDIEAGLIAIEVGKALALAEKG